MAYYDFDGYGGFPRYVSVGERRAKALLQARKLEKRGRMLEPVILPGQRIASSFWGKEWCKNLESYMDFSNRLPRAVPRLRLAVQAHRRSALRSRRAARREARAVLHAAQRGPRRAGGKERAPPRTAGEGGSRHGLPGGNFRDRTGSEAPPPRAVRRSQLVARTS